MDTFNVHSRIIGHYKQYIKSFSHIADEEVQAFVRAKIEQGEFWPEPLLQFNPNFKKGQKLADLVESHGLSEAVPVAIPFALYEHQVEAVKLGIKGKPFVVTSGTGSGKSLTFMTTIFDHVLKQGKGGAAPRGIMSVIVYPMNALINSQSEEISRYLDSDALRGKITAERFTGQEGPDDRNRLRESPPNILLTNFVMLEYIMTREGDSVLRESIAQNLRFLVFDELHTYGGRQGADVALLVRRVKGLRGKDKVVCLGTSATMATASTREQQQSIVADFANLLFGQEMPPENVIEESFERPIDHAAPTTRELADDLRRGYADLREETQVKDSALASWLYDNAILEDDKGWVRRKAPMTITELAEPLAKDSGLELDECRRILRSFLEACAQLNLVLAPQRLSYFQFRLHQFISQTRGFAMTLDKEGKTFEQELYWGKEANFLYPVVFSRITGSHFYCVQRREGLFEPRPFLGDGGRADDEPEDQGDLNDGYLFEQYDEQAFEDVKQELPASWFDSKGNVKKDKQKRLPARVYCSPDGRWSERAFEGARPMFYMPAPLVFDPSCHAFYHFSTKDNSKLLEVGGDARSSSTTLISLLSIDQLLKGQPKGAIAGERDPSKLLSFTDNRQDAALQAGHFNDFFMTAKIRGAIANAVRGSRGLFFPDLLRVVKRQLELRFEDYALKTDLGSGQRARVEEAFEQVLRLRVLEDLKRTWRYVLPNLEDCGLLRIEYQDLAEQAAKNGIWPEPLEQLDPEVRREILHDLLDYFRTSQAVVSPNRRDLASSAEKMLKEIWQIEAEGSKPTAMALGKLGKRVEYAATSLGSMTTWANYLRKRLAEKFPKGEAYVQMMRDILMRLDNMGYLHRPENLLDDKGFPLYQLDTTALMWMPGHGKAALDRVRVRAFKSSEREGNAFFSWLYADMIGPMPWFRGADHTGQVSKSDRECREDMFKEGKELRVLFCSPTMELGVDISELNIVHMRNVPPTTANYAQRAGRAGRSGQGALVFTYASGYSPHDKHYFKQRKKMVHGRVDAPRIELDNQDLVVAHVNAVALSILTIKQLGTKIPAMVQDLPDGSWPLAQDVRGQLEMMLQHGFRLQLAEAIHGYFQDWKDGTAPNWYSLAWVVERLLLLPKNFDKALERWRGLVRFYQLMIEELEAQSKQKSIPQSEKIGIVKQIASLKTRIIYLTDPEGIARDEMYPLRYLASEGILPGYNFNRLPLRVFLGSRDSDSLEEISRPRFLALSEFGPRNILYHKGQRYRVVQMMLNSMGLELQEATVLDATGYLLEKEEAREDHCPLTFRPTSEAQPTALANLQEMRDMKAISVNNITLQEEERTREGYSIKTYLSKGRSDRAPSRAWVREGEENLLELVYLPAAKLHRINSGWRNATEQNGFPIGKMGSFVHEPAAKKPAKGGKYEDQKDAPSLARLRVELVSDVLYLMPQEALGITGQDASLTLQYAFKKAVEQVFTVQGSELAVELMGKDGPNFMIYEATEGSLGVLKALAFDPGKIKDVLAKALEICKFDDESISPKASYDDLLSYYNQIHHLQIDKRLIRSALERLNGPKRGIWLQGQTSEDFERLLRQTDPSSELERRFLRELWNQKLRLPDKA